MVSDVSPSHPLGGSERMLWEQARRLAARGHDVRVVNRADPDATAPVSVERECLRRAGLVHVLSDFSADQLWKLYAVPRERIVRIRGAAATDRFTPAPDRGAIRGELGLSADRAILLTVRNLEARMGLDNLLGAMAV